MLPRTGPTSCFFSTLFPSSSLNFFASLLSVRAPFPFPPQSLPCYLFRRHILSLIQRDVLISVPLDTFFTNRFTTHPSRHTVHPCHPALVPSRRSSSLTSPIIQMATAIPPGRVTPPPSGNRVSLTVFSLFCVFGSPQPPVYNNLFSTQNVRTTTHFCFLDGPGP